MTVRFRSNTQIAAITFLFFLIGFISYVVLEGFENTELISEQTEKAIRLIVWFVISLAYLIFVAFRIRPLIINIALSSSIICYLLQLLIDYIRHNAALDHLPVIGRDSPWSTLLLKLLVAIGTLALLYALYKMLKLVENGQRELAKISEHTSQLVGPSFFPQLAKSVSEIVKVDVVGICKTGDNAIMVSQPLAIWQNDQLHPSEAFNLKGTPCEQVHRDGNIVHSDNVRADFPEYQSSLSWPTISYLGMPLCSADGNVIGNIFLMNPKPIPQSVTERLSFRLIALRAAAEIQRENTEEKVRAASQLAALGQLSAGIAHEINNPLWMLLLQVETLKQDKDFDQLGAETKKSIDEIEQQIERSSKIVKNLLAFARETKTPKSEVPISTVLESAVKFVAGRIKEKEADVQLDCPQPAPEILANPTAMEQVFVNLLQNALSAIENKGQIKIQVESMNDLVQVSVIDDGQGFEPEDRSKIFTPFYRAQNQPQSGTGLGLSIAHRIVIDHQGKIDADHNDKIGTVFIVSLPIAHQNEQEHSDH